MGYSKKSKKSAGALLGVGTYGCAFSPPINCTNSSDHSKAVVGKVVGDNEEAFDEHFLSKHIAKIDNKHKYTNPSIGICDVSTQQVIAMNPASKDYCKHAWRNLHKQLLYPHKGVSLLKSTIDLFQRETFPALIHLAKGIDLLARNHMTHMDLKQDNVIVMSDVDTRLDITTNIRLIMIDFGLSRSTDTVFSDENGVVSANYFVFPPEFQIYSFFADVNKDKKLKYLLDDFDKMKQMMKDHTCTQVKKSIQIFEGMLPDVGITWAGMKNELVNFIDRVFSSPMSIEQLETTMKPFGHKVDVWSFGVIMLECLIKNSELFADKPASPFIMKCSNIISRCLSSDPQYRYSTTALVHALLDAFKLIDVEKIVRSDIPKIQPPPTPQSVKKQTSYKSPQKTRSTAPVYVSPNTTSYKSPSPIIRSPQSPPSDLSSSYMSISKSPMSIGGKTKNKKKTKSSK